MNHQIYTESKPSDNDPYKLYQNQRPNTMYIRHSLNNSQRTEFHITSMMSNVSINNRINQNPLEIRRQAPERVITYQNIPNPNLNENNPRNNNQAVINEHDKTCLLDYNNKNSISQNYFNNISTKLINNTGSIDSNLTIKKTTEFTTETSNNSHLNIPDYPHEKRCKSPLQVYVMSDEKRRDNSRNSVNGRIINKEERLQRIILMREAEINELRKKIERINQEKGENFNEENQFNSQNYNTDNYKLKEELNSLRLENKNLKKTLDKQERHFKKQLFDIKLRYEENARNNIEIMKKELAFQYANNDNETIKVLKERIKELEKTK